MATKVHMEALSPTMEEGQLVRWLKSEGDAVQEGDVLAEIETDKATMELVARGSGVLQGIRVREGQTAPVGEVIAVIAAEGEQAEDAAPQAEAAPPAAESQPAERTQAAAESQPAERTQAAAESQPAERTQVAPESQPQESAQPAAKSQPKERAQPAAESEPQERAQPAAKSQPQERAPAAREPERVAASSQVAEGEYATEKPREVAEGATTAEPGGEEPRGTEPAREQVAARGEDRAAPRAEGNGGRIKASPLARKMATEAGVELDGVEGSGPGGRITRRDIEAAMKSAPAAAAAAQAAAPAAEAPAAAAPATEAPRAAAPKPGAADAEEVPVSQMRKAIAKRLVQSIGPIPTFYLTMEVDMTRTMELRERVNQKLEKDGIKASINDFIIKAVAAALARHPEVNASWGDNAITRHRRVHIGVAVAVEDGLITPVIRDADRKRVRDIAVEVKELAGRAREKKLKPEEYTGATFSISNLGMFGIVEFTAIINPPESGIIAVGAVEEKVVAENGETVVRPRMRMTMSCDHRVVDGATGAKFLQTVREMMEDPLAIIA